MITGAHTVLFTTDAEADRAFFGDVLGLSSVDVGGGWLIFALPPSELACHPDEGPSRHELYLLCEDVEAFVAKMSDQEVPCSAVQEQLWGRIVQVTLPSGAKLGVYEPRHGRP